MYMNTILDSPFYCTTKLVSIGYAYDWEKRLYDRFAFLRGNASLRRNSFLKGEAETSTIQI